MSNFIVDVEADGPCPGIYSMVCFGAVCVEDLSKTFYGTTKPFNLDGKYIPEALAISGFSRAEHVRFEDPDITMRKFQKWILSVNKNGRPIFWSDNLAFDWQFINYYFHACIGENPFGYSGRRIGDYYAGLKRDLWAKWKYMRKTRHDHHPVNDAMGNAEALKQILRM